jgi:hypothetical protein
MAAGMAEISGVPAIAEDAGLAVGLGSASVFCQLRRTFIPAPKAGCYERDADDTLMYYDRALEERIGALGLAWAYEKVLGEGSGIVEAAHRFARRRGG